MSAPSPSRSIITPQIKTCGLRNKVASRADKNPCQYLMESHKEGVRLEGKTNTALAERQLQETGLVEGMRALDVGCGTGAVTRIMSRLTKRVATGVDLSDERLIMGREFGGREGLPLDFQLADSANLPFEDDGFDFVWSRFLFEYLAEPEATAREMVRVAKPGGIVVASDLDAQLETFTPLEPGLESEWNVALGLVKQTGFNPRMGRRLPALLREAGLHEVRVKVEPYQVYLDGLPERDLSNWRVKLTTVSEQLVKMDGNKRRWYGLRDQMIQTLHEPGLFYYSILVTAFGKVPEH